ncbi:MAG TPA: hypothetical protein VEY71_04680 [Chitinophagales bacterium]|nr:hypothetical protein [Chitinophagales bacterium]
MYLNYKRAVNTHDRENIYQCCEGNDVNSKYDELVGKYFNVVGVQRHLMAEYDPTFKNVFYYQLLGDSSKDTLYYLPSYNRTVDPVPFHVVGHLEKRKKAAASGISMPNYEACAKLSRELDDFTGEVRINTPFFGSELKMYPAVMSKTISKGVTSYALRLETHGSTVVVDGAGVVVLFEDGTKWSKPTKIDVDADSQGFSYSAYISLTQNDLAMFAGKKIKKFRLYIFDEVPSETFAAEFCEFVKCIKAQK